jgi:hypothetical protein
MQNLDNAELERKSKIDEMFGLSPDDGDCKKNNIRIRNNISNVKKNNVNDCDDQDDDYNMGF